VIKPDPGDRALSGVLNRVRRRRGDVSEEAFARAVKDAVAEIQDALNEQGFPWGKVLIFGRLTVLTLTGVGLAVEASAAVGLAGAAAITATPAAFGPGGMVGGMVTLAVLTGTSAALTGAGLGLGLTPGSKQLDALRFQAAEGIAKSSSSELRTTVAGMLAVVAVQRRLGFESTASIVEVVLLKTLAVINEEHSLHASIAPGTRGTEEWKTKADV